jgi:hypothetical protein
MAMNIEVMVFWAVMPCSDVVGYLPHCNIEDHDLDFTELVIIRKTKVLK